MQKMMIELDGQLVVAVINFLGSIKACELPIGQVDEVIAIRRNLINLVNVASEKEAKEKAANAPKPTEGVVVQ